MRFNLVLQLQEPNHPSAKACFFSVTQKTEETLCKLPAEPGARGGTTGHALVADHRHPPRSTAPAPATSPGSWLQLLPAGIVAQLPLPRELP